MNNSKHRNIRIKNPQQLNELQKATWKTGQKPRQSQDSPKVRQKPKSAVPGTD